MIHRIYLHGGFKKVISTKVHPHDITMIVIAAKKGLLISFKPLLCTKGFLLCFLGLRPVLKPLNITSDDCVPARNGVCLHPDSNLDHRMSLGVQYKHTTHCAITQTN